MKAIITIVEYYVYKRKGLQRRNNINHRNEYDRLTGELLQCNAQRLVRHKLEKRHSMIAITLLYLQMPDILRINYSGVTPRQTYAKLINFVDYQSVFLIDQHHIRETRHI